MVCIQIRTNMNMKKKILHQMRLKICSSIHIQKKIRQKIKQKLLRTSMTFTSVAFMRLFQIGDVLLFLRSVLSDELFVKQTILIILKSIIPCQEITRMTFILWHRVLGFFTLTQTVLYLI